MHARLYHTIEGRVEGGAFEAVLAVESGVNFLGRSKLGKDMI